MTAATIAAACGNARREGRDWRCICPVHGGHSLMLRDGCNALLVKCWNGCDTRDVLAELRRIGMLAGHSNGAHTAKANVRSDDRGDADRRTEIARRIWESARNARGTAVTRYLAGRSITIPPPPSLRWVPALRRPDGTRAPAMVARVDGLDGQLIGVHRTWFDRHAAGLWRRRDRASLGPIGGGAVRLAPAAGRLLVAEGIETTLAGMVAIGLPGWAALSTSGLVALRLPEIAQAVIILVDNDRSGAGEHAAAAAASRWLSEGRRVKLVLSPEIGTDIADLLTARDPELRYVAA
jgi:putative DNA primase/helicase